MSTRNSEKDVSENEKKAKTDDVPDEAHAQTPLKTTTETSQVFFLFNDSQHHKISCGEPIPKNFNDFDHLLSKILVNLEETENVFINQAKAVLDRDLALINWRFRLKALHETLKKKKQDFERIDQTVECILKLSYHIDSILRKLEKELPEPSLMENALKFSPTRMIMYNTVMKISLNQRDMMQQLSSAVLSINDAIECNPSDPVEQFTRILSLHVEVLKTIEIKLELMEEQLRATRALHKYYTNNKKTIACDYYF